MPQHRIFIAINLPEDIKKQLLEKQAKWSELPAKWVKLSNLHITLVFLGYLPDEELLGVVKVVKKISQRHNPFLIGLTKICYGPPQKPPRLVWVEGEKSKELAVLKNDLENSLLFSEDFLPTEASAKAGAKEDIVPSIRIYVPHITLGRIRQWEFKKIEPEERPEINEEINLRFEINSIEVMESRLKKGGPEYILLESVPLGS